jgi:hypothetical protein
MAPPAQHADGSHLPGGGGVKDSGSVSDEIQTVTSLLAVWADRLPGPLVARECVHTIADYGVYRCPSVPEGTMAKRDPRDEPVKQADHAMDATRYALHGELGEAAKTDTYLAAMQRRLADMQAQG